MTAAVSLEQVTKQYRLPPEGGGLRRAVAGVTQKLRGRRPVDGERILWALRDVSFTITPGEILGVIGPNGAGKSTILKLIAGITQPTAGQVQVAGRVGSLLELGAGFHPELSGRENVFLNGQILGIDRREIAERYEAIVEFAELKDFMDMPVKRYSSGMYARLGFAVAVHMDPDILLVDEVLSVGDAAFRRKSAEAMLALVKSGKAVIFVSHNLLVVEHLCERALWLEEGQIRQVGASRMVIESYLDDQEEEFLRDAPAAPRRGRGLVVDHVTLCNHGSPPGAEFKMGSDIDIAVQYTITETLPPPRFVIGVVGAAGPLFTANMLVDRESIPGLPGQGTLTCRFRNVPLMPGAYQVYGEAWGEDGFNPLVRWSEWARFRITSVCSELMHVADDHSVYHVRADAPIAVRYDWQIERGL